ncbi:MAG: hypothetical protein EBZ24_00435 [Synechococcaceae bacterium WB9_4xB_025]|nr:hypothetical protein [Synechococcaceae bacterium WB9_4xB_025]
MAQHPRFGGDRHLAGLVADRLHAAGDLGTKGNRDTEGPLGHPVLVAHVVVKDGVVLIVVGVDAQLQIHAR